MTEMVTLNTVRDTAERWFDALARGDGQAALDVLDENVLWINTSPEEGLSDIIPWLGEYRGREAVRQTFVLWGELSEVQSFKLRKLFFEGNEAVAVVHEVALIKPTGLCYDIEFIQRLTIGNGRIVGWKSYWDTSKGIVAFRGNMKERLLDAVRDGDVKAAEVVLRAGVDPNVHAPDSPLSALMIAAGNGQYDPVGVLLKHGANPNGVDRVAGASALHKATYNGHVEITRMLANHPGINLDFQGASNGYTPLHDALWHGFEECARVLLEAGARIDLKGHDGKLPMDIAADVFGADHPLVEELDVKFDSSGAANPKEIPWESRKRNGAQAIAEQLRVAGLAGSPDNVIIGNPGSGEEWLYLELNEPIRMGLAEAAVGSIVDGAGRLRSKPAVAIAHGFVGFSGLQGDVFNAAQRQSPMLIIVGTSDSQAHTGETHMYADVEGAAKAARAKYVKNASDPETLLRDLRDAIIEASIPPFGPVVFIVGSNVASAPNTEQILAPKLPDTRLAPPDSSLESLADALLGAQKPSILVGDGVARSDARHELQEVVELLGAEVWASMESEVNLPRNHPAFQGNLGHMDDSRGRELLKDVDFALAVGTPVYQTVFNSKLPLFRPGAGIATINPDPETSLRGHNDVTFPVKGDPKRVLEILANVLKRKRTSAQTERAEARIREMRQRKEQALRQRREDALAQPGITMAKFGHLLERRMRELPVRPVIFNEALVGAAGLTDHIENANLPGKYFDTSGGALGEWAGAVGAAMTGSPTIAIIGDGGFHYALQAIWNAAHECLRLGLVVANNGGYGLLYANMDAALRARGIATDSVPRRHYYEIPSVDYLKVAEGYGVPGMRVEREEQMDEAIGNMLSSQGPFLIDLILTTS